MKNAVVAILLALVCLWVQAQEVVWLPATAIGAANIRTLSINNSIETMQPAQAAETKSFAAVVGYTMPYSLSELGESHLRGAANICNTFCLTLDVGRHGDQASSITNIGGGASKRWRYFSIGMEYYAVIHTLADNQKFTSSYSRFGFILTPNSEWRLSVCINNVEHRKIDYGGALFDIDQIAAVGAKWQPSERFSVMAEVEKNFNFDDPAGKMAVVLYPVERLQLSAGFCSQGRTPTVGVGYGIRMVSLNVGFSYHQQLGSTTGALITIKPWNVD
ncbi:MAG: hypothetical protein E7069_09000 [Bacteroidales bacterium]|jgi:hypothetical protein|nr:hypothetical protein [Bacteroidales bacterium]